jgi:hypothetical protein
MVQSGCMHYYYSWLGCTTSELSESEMAGMRLLLVVAVVCVAACAVVVDKETTIFLERAKATQSARRSMIRELKVQYMGLYNEANTLERVNKLYKKYASLIEHHETWLNSTLTQIEYLVKQAQLHESTLDAIDGHMLDLGYDVPGESTATNGM